ncbi:hypothetical protein DPM33_15070 [Mesorhizobium hawassense]|uniref:Arc-like DNA binding domain-containing protein n=1 Tax=Mesorhizobium hawassense TaxID=1209954 RepID=A0A330HZJ0_9HYPH|nr:Arc family DNA-binding protein [Mesorhizobium hawassense]RAZ90147.1 hypothetical protein DPM33_15070 [Mesorhizobium hawassense]
MAKKTLVRNQDQFLVRLPEGMRDRIKAKADRAGMSMNEAVVWCLEQYFPAPATLEDRVDALAKAVAALKRGSDLEAQIDEIVDEIDTTLREVAEGKIPASKSFRQKVIDKVEEWDMDELEAANERPFDDDTYRVHSYTPPSDDPAIPFEDPFDDNPKPKD